MWGVFTMHIYTLHIFTKHICYVYIYYIKHTGATEPRQVLCSAHRKPRISSQHTQKSLTFWRCGLLLQGERSWGPFLCTALPPSMCGTQRAELPSAVPE